MATRPRCVVLPARPARRATTADERTPERADRVALSHLDRVLWPEVGYTKRDLIDYYRAVAPVLLPHLAGRPVYLARFPEGVDAKGWYQTNFRGAPDWMGVAEVSGRRGATFRMCLVSDLDSLIWVANQGTIELHPLLATADDPDRPVELVFDLDPGPQAGLVSCCRVALAVRRLLEVDALVGRPKTSGSLGLHVVVGLDGGGTFDDSRRYARAVAARLTAELPELVTDLIPLAARVGRVLIDWRQNEPMRSMVAPYSLRATPWPLVATPVDWSEVEAVADGADPRMLLFGPADVLRRAAASATGSGER